MSSGELPLQHYNTVLCLSRILAEADACLTFANDDVMPVAAHRMAKLVSRSFLPACQATFLKSVSRAGIYVTCVVLLANILCRPPV